MVMNEISLSYYVCTTILFYLHVILDNILENQEINSLCLDRNF